MKKTKFIRYLFGVSKFDSKKDYYKALNIQKSATQKQIKSAFLQLAKKYHPDSNKGQQQLFKQINQAYQVLSDEEIKKQYDQSKRTSTSFSTDFNSFKQNNSYTYEEKKSTQRGYSPNQGWSNSNYRDQILYQIFKAQQNQKYNRERGNYGSFSDMYNNSQYAQNKQKPNVRPFDNPVNKQKIRQQQIKRAYQEQLRRRQKQFKDFKNRDQIAQQLKNKIHQMADGFVDNIKGFQKVGEFLKNTWSDIKKKK